MPEGVQKPNIDGINSTAMYITWPPPDYLYGPDPEYSLEKMATALNYPPRVIQGTRFPGGGYYKFSPETLPQNVEFTGIYSQVLEIL